MVNLIVLKKKKSTGNKSCSLLQIKMHCQMYKNLAVAKGLYIAGFSIARVFDEENSTLTKRTYPKILLKYYIYDFFLMRSSLASDYTRVRYKAIMV